MASYWRVQTGTPFRDAYKQVGLEIEAGKFSPDKHIGHFINTFLQWLGDHRFDERVKFRFDRDTRCRFIFSG